MINPIEDYYLKREEPLRSCLLALRDIIISLDGTNISEEWKYGMPFFYYKGKMFCYFWFHKKYLKPYIGIMEGASVHHPELLQEKRARVKILLIDPGKDLDMETIQSVLQQLLDFHRK